MSLETKIDALTLAIQEQTALLKQGLSARQAEKAETKTDPTAETKAEPKTEPKAETKADPKAETKADPKAKVTVKKVKPMSATAAKKACAELNKSVLAFVRNVRQEGDADEQALALRRIKKALTYLDAQDPNSGSYIVSAIPDDRMPEAMEIFKTIFDGQDPEYETEDEPEAEAEEESEELSF